VGFVFLDILHWLSAVVTRTLSSPGKYSRQETEEDVGNSD